MNTPPTTAASPPTQGVPGLSEGFTPAIGMTVRCPKGHEYTYGPWNTFGGSIYCTKGECWSDGCQNDDGSGTNYRLDQLTLVHSPPASAPAPASGELVDALKEAEAGLGFALVSPCRCDGDFICTPHKALDVVRAVLSHAIPAPAPDTRREEEAMALVREMADTFLSPDRFENMIPCPVDAERHYAEARRITARADAATSNGENVEAIAARISSTPPPDDGQQQPPEPCQP